MPAKRVLLLGPCGIGKRDVAERLITTCHWDPSSVIDFEHKYLAFPAGPKPFGSFLADPVDVQCGHWRDAWARLEQNYGIKPESSTKTDKKSFADVDENLLLVMHGAVVHGDYGVRAPYDLLCVRRFNPHLILTIIDDVFDMWWRTEAKGKQKPSRERPTLEQLLLGRRVEQLAGDQIANHVSPRPRHILLSVQHSTETAARLVLGMPRVVYLAFPISEPRRMRAGPRRSKKGVLLIDKFHKAVADFQRKNRNVVFITPLAIDELPLGRRLDDEDVKAGVAEAVAQKTDPPPVLFRRARERWNLTSFVSLAETLSSGPPPDTEQKRIPYEQVLYAAGTIRADVAARDYRLVAQAHSIAVFNPVMNNKTELETGVRNEIEYASTSPLTDRTCVYQDPKQDRNKTFEKWLGKKGSLGERPVSRQIVMCKSVGELLESAAAP